MSAVSKSIRNTTGSPIPLNEIGLEIAAGDTYILTLDEYLRWANPDAITELTPLINSGNLVVNDGIGDLVAADGIRFLQYPDRAYVQKNDVDITKVNVTLNFEPGAFDVIDEGNGKATVTIPADSGDFEDDRLIHVVCAPGTSCVAEVSLLVDQTQCFIKKEDC